MNNLLKDIIIEEYKKGKIVFETPEELAVVTLDNFIDQPIEGILYDLNLLPEVILSGDVNSKWIRDYAISQIITRLKQKIDGKEASDENMV